MTDDPFGEPEGASTEYETLKDYDGELVLVKVTGVRTVTIRGKNIDAVVHDFVVLTGEKAGYQVEGSDVLNSPINRELKPYLERDQFFLGRVESFTTSHGTQSLGFKKPTDEDKKVAREFLEENGLA